MKCIETPLSGAYVIELEPHRDERGLFARVFCQKEYERIGFHGTIVQINHSLTRQRATIRGMHYQLPPASETKIIRCVRGRVFDVMVDLRADSPTLRQWHGVELSEENMRVAYIPEGFAHGFQTLTDGVELAYHHSAFYSPEHERGLKYDDPVLAIRWPLPVSTISSNSLKVLQYFPTSELCKI
ncbi:MAG: dTDP-4-dehydrorhamnose 3,5-epimerase [Phycisphaerales bacterium]|nr:MAG: dTDP-4-dehydrorhamnose 3,5-epimerase [Phycisphaerales bacterium]